MALTKVKSGMRTLGTDEVVTANIKDGDVTTAKMAVDPTNASNLSSGSVPAAQLANAGTAWQAVTTGATLTAVAGRGYPINTTSNACTVTLPASASVGDTIEFVDYAGTWDTNSVTLDPQTLNIKGATTDLELNFERQGVRIVYVDATQGWVAATGVNETNPAISSFSATGGTVTTYGIYTVHTFLTSANFTCTGSGSVDVMIVGLSLIHI